MAFSKIQFEDKVDLYEDNSINRINKVVADDMNEIKSVVNTLIDGIFEAMFPVGSKIYNTGVNPSTYLGGTWVLDNPGAVSVCQDVNDSDFDTVGKTGGSKFLQEHTHNVTKKWAKSGEMYGYTDATPYFNGYGSGTTVLNSGNVASGVQTGNSGNVQPYVVDCRWVKVSNTANDTQAITTYNQSQAQINANNSRNESKKSNGDDGETKKEESK